MSFESECLSRSQGEQPSSTCSVYTEEAPSQPWLLKSYRPRGSLARTLYEKQIADNYLNSFDKEQVGKFTCSLEFSVFDTILYHDIYG